MAGDHLATAPGPPLPAAGLSREEVARREVGHTDVAAATARLLVVAFLVMIAAVPLIEWRGVRALRAEGLEPSWSHLVTLPQDVLAAHADVSAGEGPWLRIVRANRRVLAGLTAFENGLEDESVLGRALRPPAQLVLTKWLGAGNERVYKGSDGWLYYRPDVEYVTGRPFLDERTLRRRIASASEWDEPPQPDPRPALAQFRRDLEARGIALVVMPTPVKPSVHPEGLAARYEGAVGPVQNPSYASFLDDLRAAGTLVFDPAEALANARRFGPQYLATDTHWRPESMEEVADLLARFIT